MLNLTFKPGRRLAKMRFLTVLVLLAFTSAYGDMDIPENVTDSLYTRIVNSGPDALIEYIEEFNPPQRLQLYQLAREVMVFSVWEGQNLDDIVTVAEAGIQEAMGQANNAPNSLATVALLDLANVMSYNLSADLAECWPGDTLTRHERHFERGLSAALQCVAWRHELDKGDYSLFIAFWAAGMHQLSLDRPREAVYNLVSSLSHAQQYTIDQDRPIGLAPQVGFELILAHGYLGLAMEMCGDDDDQYERAISAFEEGSEEYPELQDDYRFGIAQLQWVRTKLLAD
jgi:hypothetical protein